MACSDADIRLLQQCAGKGLSRSAYATIRDRGLLPALKMMRSEGVCAREALDMIAPQRTDTPDLQ